MTQDPNIEQDSVLFEDTPILVVEDNPVNFMVLEKQLLKLGCRVYGAQDGEKGLALFTQETFSCVLMDCMLPGMSGQECTQHIREYEQKNNRIRTPIIALTADIRESNKQASFDADMDDFMGKPFKFADLNNILNVWIKQQKTDDNPV